MARFVVSLFLLYEHVQSYIRICLYRNKGKAMIYSMNIAWWVKRWSELNPAKTAIIVDDLQISYRQLYGRYSRTASWLFARGIRKGHRVSVLLRNCPEFIEVYLACARLGAIFVPLNFRVTASELAYFIDDAQPRMLIFNSGYAALVEDAREHKTNASMQLAVVGSPVEGSGIESYRDEVLGFPEGPHDFSPEAEPSDPEEPQVIMYTSGTTGKPKGAVLSHRKTFFNCLNAEIFFKLNFDDRMLIILPLFHSGGLFIQAAPTLYKGATLIIHPKFDPGRVFSDIERYRATKLLGVPTVFKALIDVPPEERSDISSLKVCAGGGEKTTPELLEQCRAAGLSFRQVMGQTETSILLWASEEDSYRKPGTVGKPVFHADVKLIDKQHRRVKPGQVGEIVARGAIMMNAYWRDPVKTRDVMREGYLHTGDLARMDEEGYFYLVDRLKDMYISGGENVYPAEVERVLREHPQIEDVAIKGIPDPKWGEVGHAFIIPKAGKALEPQEVIKWCESRLARYKLPKEVTFCREFPRTSLGKVRKAGLC
jgi:fatty-acyl-CoA synthase